MVETLRSLTRDEARERAALVTVDRYDIALDLSDLDDGDAFRAVSTISFRCSDPGATTFLDCAAQVVSATLHGEPLPDDAVGDARITLTGLRSDNVVVVESVQRCTGQATGIHRSVDPADEQVYVWTSFEPDDARRAWACFDQPDLKAVFALTVTAPQTWTVLSNSAPESVEDSAGARRWTFADTPPLSTYVPVVNAGPFHERRVRRDGHDLGLYARQSLAAFLDRDAEEIFDVTAAGLAFFGEQFAMPFPQERYDHVFVPDMGGAMENYGCVTWSDSAIYRSAPTHTQREDRAGILLHEMAHMWFGDIVTMRWWDDLWLNEAFAEWASNWASTRATEFSDAWAGFLTSAKLTGYRADRAPTTHPIRQPVDDVAEAAAGFDHITYWKGASVLKQLVAYVGEERFVAGLRSYFTAHAWANATLGDLVAQLREAGGRDLSGWVTGWLETAGTDRLRLEASGAGFVLHAEGPGGGDPRPHRVDVGVYDDGEDTLVRRDLVPLETAGARTPLPPLDPAPYLLLVNDEDLTFAAVQPDDESLAQLITSAGRLPRPLSRAVAVQTVWDMLVTDRIPAVDFVRCVLGVLVRETADSVVEPFLALAVSAAELWSPDEARDELLSSVAEVSLELAGPDGSRRQAALRTLARTATTPGQLDALRELAGRDLDLRWRALTRLAALDRLDRAELQALLDRDPDPDAWGRALAVETAQPDAAAKETAWRAAVEERRVPISSLHDLAASFWQPSQAALLAPYAERYVAALPQLSRAGMLVALSTTSAMFPVVGVVASDLDRTVDAAADPEISPLVRRVVLEKADQVRHMLTARAG
ncbi:MAG: aminopeptidase [Actinomycetota bacterium]|jgi:aminopeptidase N|nr:aminopeptidase [Actinomycetota bacterium]